MSFRLTVTFPRTKGLPGKPDTVIPGGRVTELHDTLENALVRIAEMAVHRPVNQVTITDLALADRNYERARASL